MSSEYHQARVYLAQAKATPHRSFRITLQKWAAKARVRGMRSKPIQGKLL